MADTITITAEARDRAGKGAARAARRAGMIPSVIYGDKQPPVMVSINGHSLLKILKDPAQFTHLYDIKVGKDSHHVLMRDVQLDPVTDIAIHIDFLRVSDTTKIEVEVPVRFVNEDKSPGIKRGGVLNVVRHEVEVTCRASAIPEELVIDLTGAQIGDSLHISNVKLPNGVAPTITDRDFTIATVAAPTVVSAEASEAQEGEEEEGEEQEEGEE
ncbi:50S ribosomal protein L25/general stress protein Ctc [Inquilinus sp. CAU 1745]|uniref:50S ribosomal protein L25/general stress protein Ctc n=1 Tax=Inquilinus sp. CAU 1745 TaxID=3140369 RepID=UPI00325A99D7